MIANLIPYSEMKNSGIEWCGEVPAHWEVTAVGRHFTIQLGKMLQTSPNDPADIEVSYLKAQHVQWFQVRTTEAPQMWASPNDRTQFGIAPGDLLVCEGGEGGRCGIVKRKVDGYIIQNALHRVRPCGQNRNDYLQYMMSAVAATNWFVALNDKTTIAHFTRWKFAALRIPIPPFEDQAAIVRFLDHADRRIRRYIRAKQKLITLLEEQNQAIIHRAVTRGIDAGAKLKATGTHWFPDVPAHWDVMPMRRVITRAVDGPHHSPEYIDHGIPFLSARNIKVDRWSLEDVKFISQIDYESFCQRIKPALGDVLYTKGGTTGVARAVDLDYPFQVWVHVAVLKLRKARILPRYLATALNSRRCYEQSQLFTRGATNQDLGLGRMKDIVIPVPPLTDQADIIERVVAIEDQIGSGIEAALHEIELLREYRTRLIADVVTGKLDVREAAAGLPEVDPLSDEFDAPIQAAETGVMELEDATESPEELAMENEVII